MKISIITVVYNDKNNIEETIRSVLSQNYNNIEYILIDGGSTDGTIEIIKQYEKKISLFISEPDNGIYDAMNKGIGFATGDVIGLLNSGDFYYSEFIISKIVNSFMKCKIDACYGDLVYVDSDDTKKIKRYWKSGIYKKGLLKKGWMPPHPTFFLKKEMYDKFGLFNTAYKISADYDLMLRYIKNSNIVMHYIQEILITMRVGGKSNKGMLNLLKKSIEDYNVWRKNKMGIFPSIILKKPMSKLSQFFKK